MKILSAVFGLLAVLLSDIMCAVVAYNYSNLSWGAEIAGFSAPPCLAFLLAIPFLIGIIICIILAIIFKKRARSH